MVKVLIRFTLHIIYTASFASSPQPPPHTIKATARGFLGLFHVDTSSPSAAHQMSL
jgi:hypothetical protein